MTAPVYLHPAGGYATLWPPRDLGSDYARAVVATGNGSQALCKRRSPAFALWLPDHPPAGLGRRVDGQGERAAFAQAHDLVLMGKSRVVVLRSVTPGPREVWQRVATLSRAPSDDLVTPLGVVVKAKLDPLRDGDFRRMARNLGERLGAAGLAVTRPGVDAFVAQLRGIDWSRLDAPSRLAAVMDAASALRATAEAEQAAVAATAKTELTLAAQATRASVKERFLGRIGIDMAAPEVAAVQQIATQQGWFVRGSNGQRNAKLTELARATVARGLAEGLGREQIGRELERDVPGLWTGMGQRYANLLAANALARARTTTELQAYQAAGVTYAEVMAMLDERTSDICRLMDGQVIPVADMAAHAQAAARARPEDIADVAPFMSMGRNKDKELEIRCQGRTMATVDRSGAGIVNDRGSMRQHVGGHGFGGANVGGPPYHHNCRTTLVPRPDISQVPKGYDVRATTPAALPDGTPPADPTGNLVSFPAPSKGAPVQTGSLDPVSSFMLPGWDAPAAGSYAESAAYTPDWMSVRISRGFMVDVSYVPTSAWDAVLLTAPSTPKINLGHPTDPALLQVATADTLGAIGSLGANPASWSRQTLMQVRRFDAVTRQAVGEEWVRIEGKVHAERIAKAAEAYHAATTPEERAAAARAFVTTGETEGWLRRAPTLAGLAAPQRRGGNGGGGPAPVKGTVLVREQVEPGKVPASALASQPQVGGTKALKGKQPARTLAADAVDAPKPVAASASLAAVPVRAEVYANRPSGAHMAQLGLKQRNAGVWQAGEVSEDGRLINKARDKWSAANKGTSLFDSMAAVKPAEKSKLVSVFVAGDADLYSWKGRTTVRLAIEQNARLGHGTARDWTIQTDRGDAAFLRFRAGWRDKWGAASADKRQAALGAFVQKGDTSGLEALGVSVTDDVRVAYPKAEIDWTQRNLIPGVAVAEQVKVRMEAVQAEIDARVGELQAKLGREATPVERAEVVIDMVKASAATEKASTVLVDRHGNATAAAKKAAARYMRQSYPASDFKDKVAPKIEVVPKKWQDSIVDATYKHCSNGLLQACAPHGTPTFYTVYKWEARAFHAPSEYQEAGKLGSLISLNDHEMKAAAWVGTQPSSISDPVIRKGFETAQHEVGHALATIGRNGAAAEHARNLSAVDGPLVKVGSGKNEWGVSGTYFHKYAGKLYGDTLRKVQAKAALNNGIVRAKDLLEMSGKRANEKATQGEEYLSMALQHINDPAELAEAMRKDKNLAPFVVSVLRGHYVPH